MLYSLELGPVRRRGVGHWARLTVTNLEWLSLTDEVKLVRDLSEGLESISMRSEANS